MPSGKSNSREVEDLRLAERLGGVPPLVLLPDHRRVEALLDDRPDRESRREDLAAGFVADHEIGAVSHAQLVDLGEEVVGGIPGENVREARFDADADEGEQPLDFPLPGLVELLLTQQHSGQLVRPLRMPFGQ